MFPEPPPWLMQDAPDMDVVLSCRVRLARNLLHSPFPHRATEEQLRTVADVLVTALQQKGLGAGGVWSLDQLDSEQRARLVGARVISPLFWQELPHRWILADHEGCVVALINEEDHLRLQITLSGWQPDALWNLVKEWEGRLTSLPGSSQWARLPTLGYLTASPVNLGNGIRLGLLMHLIGLQRTQQIQVWLEALQTLGCTTRGLYGEGSLAFEGYVQVSLSGGQEPLKDLLARLRGTLLTMMEAEREARNQLTPEIVQQELHELRAILHYTDQLSLGTTLRILAVHRLAALKGVPTLPYRLFDHLLFHLAVYPPPEPPSASVERAHWLRQELGSKGSSGLGL